MKDLPDVGKGQLVDMAENFRSQAEENAPLTVKFSYAGTIVGAVAFGPAGGVVGATVGSSVGYLTDKGYFDSDKEPNVIQSTIKEDD